MVPCDERCQLYNRCNVRYPNIQRCVFDMGFDDEEDNGDKFLEKITF